jgi:hypothetical protein
MSGRKITAEMSPKDKSALLNDAVFYEIIFALGVSDHDTSDYCVWEHLNFSRMGHARALIYFFECAESRRRWPDDLLSEDFGFPARSIGLSQEDKDRLNKDLFHLSFSRLRHDAASKPWPHTILKRVHERCVEFVQFLLSPRLPSEISPVKSQWQALLNVLQSGHELRITRFFEQNGRDSGWAIGLGRSLGSGLAELTPLTRKHSPIPGSGTTAT